MKNFHDLKRFAEAQGFFVTSTTGGKHNVGSKHALGLAVDVRTRDKTNEQIERFMRQCAAIGVRVRDERSKPANQKLWSGAHLHLEINSQTLPTFIRFQKSNNLIADGILGAKSLAAVALIS